MAKKAWGILGKIGGAGGTALAEVYSITPPGTKVSTIETTHHGSADGHRTFMSTLADGGEVQARIALTPANLDELNACILDDTVSYYISCPQFSPALTWTFTGILTDLSPAEAEIDGKLELTATFKVTGKPVIGGLS